MKVHVKTIILVLVVLAVGAIFVIPYVYRGPGVAREFTVTENPGAKLAQAAKKNRPVFLEFYSPA